MAYYDALITAWNAGGLPPGTSGTPITAGMTTAQKVTAVNSWTMPGPTDLTVIPTYKIYNAIVPADFQGLPAASQQLIRDIFSMGTVDASPGTNVNSVLANTFAGKVQTLGNLQALANSFKTTIPWWRAVGLLASAVNENDAAAAGLA